MARKFHLCCQTQDAAACDVEFESVRCRVEPIGPDSVVSLFPLIVILDLARPKRLICTLLVGATIGIRRTTVPIMVSPGTYFVDGGAATLIWSDVLPWCAVRGMFDTFG